MDTTALDQTSRKCRTCFALVTGRPKRCPHCHAFQDNRRHLTPLNIIATIVLLSILGGLLKLLSVLPPLYKHGSEVHAAVNMETSDVIRAHVSFANSGDRPAIVTHALLEFDDDSTRHHTVPIRDREGSSQIIVPANAVVTLPIKLVSCPGHAEIVSLRLWIRNFDGDVQLIELPQVMSATCNASRKNKPS
jgi:hypothetical protein